MPQSVDTILAALVPIFALIALGHLLRRLDFPGDGFWPQLERLVYYVLFPALLVQKLATAPVDGSRILPVAAAVLMLAAMTVLVLALRWALPVDGPGFTSVYQGSIRFNTYLGVATALAVYGAPGGATAALTLALVNVLSVAVLTRYTGGSGLRDGHRPRHREEPADPRLRRGHRAQPKRRRAAVRQRGRAGDRRPRRFAARAHGAGDADAGAVRHPADGNLRLHPGTPARLATTRWWRPSCPWRRCSRR